jgi:hypothetical protein
VAGSIFDGVAMALNSEEASFVDTVSYLDCYLIFKAQTDFPDGEAQALSKLLEGLHKYRLGCICQNVVLARHNLTLSSSPLRKSNCHYPAKRPHHCVTTSISSPFRARCNCRPVQKEATSSPDMSALFLLYLQTSRPRSCLRAKGCRKR